MKHEQMTNNKKKKRSIYGAMISQQL